MSTTKSAQAWAEFDRLVAAEGPNPWATEHASRRFQADLQLLEVLLAVPLRLGLKTQSGIPAKAVDVWLARELRRAGFGADEVWPRAAAPRVLPREVSLLLGKLPPGLRSAVHSRIDRGLAGPAVSADAYVLGKAYRKQVDVVISQWARGPELLISTKRMDSSLANNAFNRIEESYGDAHNLRGRHPLAAIGYVLVLRDTALEESRSAAERLIDLVAKMAGDDAGYDATAVVVAGWDDTAEDPQVQFKAHLVPEDLRIGAFVETMVRTVLDRTPVDAHVMVRERLQGAALPVQEDEGGIESS